MADIQNDTPLQSVEHPVLESKGADLLVRRDDLVHPQISGNKWYKLKYNIENAKAQGYKTLLSFGGAFSNHLHALAFAGKEFGLKTIGVIRGELVYPLNPSLQDMVDWGMQLVPLSRSDYRRRYEEDFVTELCTSFQPCYVVPEGGANALALKGCAEVSQAIEQEVSEYDFITVPCGTGATLAGLVSGMRNRGAKALGFCALKGLQDIEQNVQRLLAQTEGADTNNWRIEHQFHCGGFAKLTPELVRFMDEWRYFSEIPLEPIYTGKMFYGLFQLLEKGYFDPGTRIVAVHTGGLQGLRGMAEKMESVRKDNKMLSVVSESI